MNNYETTIYLKKTLTYPITKGESIAKNHKNITNGVPHGVMKTQKIPDLKMQVGGGVPYCFIK